MATKRPFTEIRNKILLILSTQKTLNQIATETEINWRTVNNHLTYLKGMDIVKEVFSSPYVRIFELTEKGKEIANKLDELNKT